MLCAEMWQARVMHKNNYLEGRVKSSYKYTPTLNGEHVTVMVSVHNCQPIFTQYAEIVLMKIKLY